MVVVGEEDETTRATTANRQYPTNRDILLNTPSLNATWPGQGLPRKDGAFMSTDQEFGVNTTREAALLGREYFKDNSTFHEYVNIETIKEHREPFENCRRNDSLDLPEERYSLPVVSRLQSDYEFMSSPDSFSSSSNRSSNTSSLTQSSSADSASLSSFSDRFVFGRAEGSHRCSQASSASSSRSSRQSWGKPGECLDFINGGSLNTSIYENTPQQDIFLRKNRKMSLGVEVEEPLPPPLPVRQVASSIPHKAAEVELIMPYKVVDLEELQRSLLDDIEPYYTHNGSDVDDDDCTYNEINELPVSQGKIESNQSAEFNKRQNSKPMLPPKHRTLNPSLSDTFLPRVPNGEVSSAREKPTPLPRHLNKQASESDDETNPRLSSTNGHLSRQKSLPVGRVIHSRRQSTSPHRTVRPQRSAPPPPPTPLHHDAKSPSARPVSEMLPRNQSWNRLSPTALKRSNTVSMAQLSSSNTSTANRMACSSSSPPAGDANQTRDDTGKLSSSKTGAFLSKSKALKKAFTKAVTKKQPKKELVIGPPTDFASLYPTPVTAEREDRERKTVSFLDHEELETSASPQKLEAENGDDGDEEVYHNFPISRADDNPEQLISPKKPPRRFTSPDGYLLPSTTQHIKEQEEQISQNKLPELGPLPTTPLSSPETTEPPTKVPSEEDSKPLTKEGSLTPVVTKPKVPRRPDGLKPKLQKKPTTQVTKQQPPRQRSSGLDTAETQTDTSKEDSGNTKLAGLSQRSRSCDALNVADTQYTQLTIMHLTVLKDILLRWRNMLRRPKISLAGACWEDFEIVEGGSWPKISEAHGSVLQPVQLKKSSLNLNTKDCESHFIAKIKSQTHSTNTSKSCYDQDYSVCSNVEPHENVARVLAYFRGDIKPQLLGTTNPSSSPFHTTISITDQVPTLTCDEFVAKSMDIHNDDPYSYERVVCLLVLQCIMGLDHLHSAGFTHGNLVLRNLFLIKHVNDLQLFLGNFGKSQPLPKERRGTESLASKPEGVTKPSGIRDDLKAISKVIAAMLHSLDNNDQNGNHAKCRTSSLFGFLGKVSEKLRKGTTTLPQAAGLLQALLWGPFKVDGGCILSEERVSGWLERQRGEFVAKLAMEEALSRTLSNNNRSRFSMEDFLLCDYLSKANTKYLMRIGKRWFYNS